MVRELSDILKEYADLNWSAGFFDGEGTFQIAKYPKYGRHSYAPRMRIGGCHKGSIERFASIMDTGAVVMENTPAKNSNFKQYRWSASGRDALVSAKKLRDLLTVKQLECDILLLWNEYPKGHNKPLSEWEVSYREGLYQMMRKARTEQLVRVGE